MILKNNRLAVGYFIIVSIGLIFLILSVVSSKRNPVSIGYAAGAETILSYQPYGSWKIALSSIDDCAVSQGLDRGSYRIVRKNYTGSSYRIQLVGDNKTVTVNQVNTYFNGQLKTDIYCEVVVVINDKFRGARDGDLVSFVDPVTGIGLTNNLGDGITSGNSTLESQRVVGFDVMEDYGATSDQVDALVNVLIESDKFTGKNIVLRSVDLKNTERFSSNESVWRKFPVIITSGTDKYRVDLLWDDTNKVKVSL